MITEKRFAQSHQSFWQRTLPTATAYIRAANLALERFDLEVSSELSENRGVVNESAFRIFCRAHELGIPASTLAATDVEGAVLDGVDFIRRFRQRSGEEVEPPSSAGVREAILLADSTERALTKIPAGQVVLAPEFPGCGWVDSCNGDILVGTTLCEVKAGESRFRSVDLRQILIYCALASEAKSHRIDNVCLINPRLGVMLFESVSSLCAQAAATHPGNVLAEIIAYVSESEWRDEAV